MGRKIAAIMVAAALIFIVFLVYRIYAGVLAKREVANRIAVLPEFDFTTLDGKTLHRSDVPNDIPTALVYFNTTCPHCNAEIEDILTHSTLLDSVYFLVISRQKPEILSQFFHEKKLDEWNNIVVVTDARDLFPKTFGTAMVPTLLLYGKDRRLVKIFKGETSARAIRKALFINR
ncbi:MAG: redoxin domain-containing protein [candidate division KSB1 bacterium]|nr:redoxin domain-containing protein [candidate division KSB1 bacterium]MDZ7303711.1 redoxin domain-containing protein [candidate division KSB1 bacterium]MDZ7313153.1 redoxin domain-containing protein [candidate division KSB1 bacterium]